MKNTTSSEDLEIKAAEESSHIQNLVDIIDAMDKRIEAWRSAASQWSCDTPEELIQKIDQLPE